MGYEVENCTGTSEQLDEAAEFLADFVADGEASGGGGRVRGGEFLERKAGVVVGRESLLPE